MLNRTQILPAGLCLVLAASLIALPGCAGRGRKKEAKADKTPVITAKGSEELAAERAAAEAGEGRGTEVASAAAAEPAPEPQAADVAPEAAPEAEPAPRGRAFDDAAAPPPADEPPIAEAAAPEEEPPPVVRPKARGKRRAARAAAPPIEDEAGPAADATEAAHAGAGDYVVVRGDTISKIARTHHTSAKKLMAANHISDPTKLKVGQKLAIP